jgi:capsular polysaccharide biosynthesis protein
MENTQEDRINNSYSLINHRCNYILMKKILIASAIVIIIIAAIVSCRITYHSETTIKIERNKKDTSKTKNHEKSIYRN